MNETKIFSRHRGLTLIEASISLVIVSTLIVVFLNLIGSLARGQQIIASKCPATCLANQLMAEILQNPYVNPDAANTFGPDAGEAGATRANFDDVDDYSGYVEPSPQLKDGTPVTGYTGWTRTAAVDYINPDTMAASGTDLGVKRITVVVKDPRGRATSITALRSSTGTYDQKPAAATTCVRWIGVKLQVDSDSSSQVSTGASPLSIVPQ
jgi:type II secretory pathway pseudopilin PulG